MSEQGLSTSNPMVVAVVLTWNDVELTTKCLASVLASSYSNLKVLLVDNGSTPQCGPELKKNFPEIEVLQLDVNQGFSGGANRGLERALEMDADFIHLIGNDATLAVDTIELLVEALEADTEAGAASPLFFDPGEERRIQFYTATMDRETARHFHHDTGGSYRPEQFPTTISEFIPMVALCFRAQALRSVGLLDESFGTCWEDFDLCIRFQDAGWHYLTVGAAHATHIGSYTTGRTSPYIVYYTVRNRLICLSRYAPSGYWRRRGFEILRSFWFQIKSYGVTNWACHWAMIRGVCAYVFNVRGEQKARAVNHQPGHNA